MNSPANHHTRAASSEVNTDQKIRSKSANPRIQNSSPTRQEIVFGTDPMANAFQEINFIRITSFKLVKNRKNGSTFAVYVVNVIMKNGVNWNTEKRYSEFRALHKELRRVFDGVRQLRFPQKKWFFNLSDAHLKERKDVLETYLIEVLKMRPVPMELHYFLEVSQNMRASTGDLNRSASFGSLTSTLSIHDFELIKVLGQGSFGKVYLVRPIGAPIDEVYAMKVLKKSEVERRRQVEHTKSERKIMAIVHSPFILCLRYAFQTPQKLYMVTDYCPGGELFFHLKKMRRFTENMLRFYSAEISLALAHLHGLNIVYRDMKPENVLLDRQGHVKLTDFGLSKVLPPMVNGRRVIESGARPLTFCGTPEYLAPELILHRRNNTGYDTEVDWWSLGIVCFELITGWPPFFDKEFERMCDKILRKPVRFPSKYAISIEAQQLIMNFLERDPARRLGTKKAGGMEALQDHMFYTGLEWEEVANGTARPPFTPMLGTSVDDTRNFDTEFTKMSVKESPSLNDVFSSAGHSLARDEFEGFSFMDDDYKNLRDRRDLSAQEVDGVVLQGDHHGHSAVPTFRDSRLSGDRKSASNKTNERVSSHNEGNLKDYPSYDVDIS